MGFNYTVDQQKVLDARKTNVLVSAAAGSGKTAVLVERIARLVCERENNIDIDNLLVVTFTKAAAAEMKERIHNKIAERLEEFDKKHAIGPDGRMTLSKEDAKQREHLQKQYALVHRAMITTIDSFCQNVLRNHFQEIDFDPDFRVMDDAEKPLMKQDVLAELLEEEYTKAEPDFLMAVEFFAAGSHQDTAFAECISELYEYAESFARPAEYLEEQKSALGHDSEMILDSSKGIGKYFANYVKGMLAECADMYEVALGICDLETGPIQYRTIIEKEFDFVRTLRNYDDLILMEKELSEFEFSRLPGAEDARIKDLRKNVPELVDDIDAQKKAAKDLRDACKNCIKDIAAKFFTPSLEEAIASSDMCAQPLSVLIDTTLKFREKLQERKREEKVVDFGDLEHFALDILENDDGSPSAVALEYREHFKEVMCDEYQDSNEIQERLLDAVSSKEIGHFDRFMVGDIKQSIYGFRQARPDIFNEKYNTYPDAEGCERIDLSMNFRSRKEVLDSVNDVFDYIMHNETGNVEYDAASRLNAGADFESEDEAAGFDFMTELVLFEPKFNAAEESADDEAEGTSAQSSYEDEPTEDDSEKQDRAEFAQNECEAEVLANLVLDLKKSQKVLRIKKVDGKEIRTLEPVEYKDIVILHRSPSGLAESLGTVFERHNIPISISQGGGYYSTREIKQILQFLRAIDNPLQDIPLYGTMTSVFGGYTAEEMANIRSLCPGEPLYEAVKQGAPEFVEKLNKYRDMTTYLTVRELLQKIIDDYNYSEYVAALPAGEKRRANVEMLLSRASDFEKTSYFGLHQFVRFMDQLKKYTEDRTSEADVLGENANVVRFMSIHKSKGLEFPVTILAGVGKQFNFKDAGGSLVHNTELGIGCNYVDPDKRVKSVTIRKNLISKKICEDTIAEEMRLLYVAMTRAKEKLIIVGACKNAQEILEKALDNKPSKYTYAKFMNSKSYLDFILPVIGSPNFSARVFTMQDVHVIEAQESILLDERIGKLDNANNLANEEKLSQIQARLSYEYPFKYLEKLYTKTTVSELKMAAMLDENEAAHEKFEERERSVYVPEFRREKGGISGTVRGDSYHRVMEIMDFDRVLGSVCGGLPGTYDEFVAKADKSKVLDNIKALLDEQLREHRITAECYEAVNPFKIREFMLGRLAYRMWKSNCSNGLKREQPFVMSVSANKVDKDFPEEEKLIIQGIIDAYFIEDGKVVLMDYKTDSVDTAEEFVSRYHAQLDYYQEAIEKLTGMKVAERILYSFHMGSEINCPK